MYFRRLGQAVIQNPPVPNFVSPSPFSSQLNFNLHLVASLLQNHV